MVFTRNVSGRNFTLIQAFLSAEGLATPLPGAKRRQRSGLLAARGMKSERKHPGTRLQTLLLRDERRRSAGSTHTRPRESTEVKSAAAEQVHGTPSG